MNSYQQELLIAQFGARLCFHEELGSTNDKALQLARRGCEDGTIVLAERQTAGRGRRGTEWFSGEGNSIAFSLILRPELNPALWSRLSLVAGLAVARILERRQIAAEIKWPNDVLVQGKKICGILVEAEKDAVVFGIGLNTGQADFPAALSQTATSIHALVGGEVNREEILEELVTELNQLVGKVQGSFSELLIMIRERCYLTGQRINYLAGDTPREGVCEGIGEGGELLVRDEEQGVIQRVIAAEIIRVRS